MQQPPLFTVAMITHVINGSDDDHYEPLRPCKKKQYDSKSSVPKLQFN